MCQDLSSDDSTAKATFFGTQINVATGKILHQMGLYLYEEDGTLTSVADQQQYELPVRNIRVKEVTYTSGDTPYVVREISDDQQWLKLNEITDYTATWPEYYRIVNDKIEFFPTPSTSDDTITVRGEYRFKAMDRDNYTTGTVTMVNGDATVEGAGSPAWSTATNIEAGDWFKVNNDGYWYKIDSITDADTLELDKDYEGTAGSALAYTIGEQALGAWEDLHELPVWWALMQYYGGPREDRSQYTHYKNLWDEGWDMVKNTYSKETSSNVIASRFQVPNRYEPGVYRGY